MKTENNLAEWLTDSKAAAYFGRTFAVRADVLAHFITGTGTLADIGRKHGVSRQAVQKHAKKAQRIYFEPADNRQLTWPKA
jgi:hypothetical protein